MTISKKAAVSISALSLAVGLGVGFGVASCSAPVTTPSAPVTVSASPTATAEVDQKSMKTPAEAKKALDSFLSDVKRESAVFGETDSFKDKYKDSYTHLQQGITDDKAREIIETFSLVYQMDPNASVDTKEADFNIEGDTAKISGKSFTLTINGKPVDTSSSDGAGTLVLNFSGDKWSISEMESGK